MVGHLITMSNINHFNRTEASARLLIHMNKATSCVENENAIIKLIKNQTRNSKTNHPMPRKSLEIFHMLSTSF